MDIGQVCADSQIHSVQLYGQTCFYNFGNFKQPFQRLACFALTSHSFSLITCRSIMRAVLSSLVLLFGSAMAIPSLLRTGQSDKNDNGSLFNYYLDDNDDDIDNNIWDGEGRGEREG